MKTVVYVYTMTNDSGFAPCVQNNWLTLSCCKGGLDGGMRKSAAMEFISGNTVYIIGLCGEQLKTRNEMLFYPVYMAKLDEVIPMTSYYMINGRAINRIDDVYTTVNNQLQPKPNNPHSPAEQEKDKCGMYVLCAHQFTYWGDKCGSSGAEIERDVLMLPEYTSSIKNAFCSHRGIRKYRVDRNFVEFEILINKWEWFPKGDFCNIISNYSISGKNINDWCCTTKQKASKKRC